MKHKVIDRPDGQKTDFNCCRFPNVRWEGEIGDSDPVCQNCGYDWTKEVVVDA